MSIKIIKIFIKLFLIAANFALVCAFPAQVDQHPLSTSTADEPDDTLPARHFLNQQLAKSLLSVLDPPANTQSVFNFGMMSNHVLSADNELQMNKDIFMLAYGSKRRLNPDGSMQWPRLRTRIDDNLLESLIYGMDLKRATREEYEMWDKMEDQVKYARSSSKPNEYNMPISKNQFWPRVEAMGDYPQWIKEHCNTTEDQRTTLFFNTTMKSSNGRETVKANVTFSYLGMKAFPMKPFNWFNQESFNQLRRFDTSNMFPQDEMNAIHYVQTMIVFCDGSVHEYQEETVDTETGEHLSGLMIRTGSPDERRPLGRVLGYYMKKI